MVKSDLSLEERILIDSRKKLIDVSRLLLEKITQLYRKDDFSTRDIIKVNELSLMTSVAEKRYNLAFAYAICDPFLNQRIIEEINGYKLTENEIEKRVDLANTRIESIREFLKEKTGEYKLQTTNEWEYSVYEESIAEVLNQLEKKKSRIDAKELQYIRKKTVVYNIITPKIDRLEIGDTKPEETSAMQLKRTKSNDLHDIEMMYR